LKPLKVVGFCGKSVKRVEVETEGKIAEKSSKFNHQIVKYG